MKANQTHTNNNNIPTKLKDIYNIKLTNYQPHRDRGSLSSINKSNFDNESVHPKDSLENSVIAEQKSQLPIYIEVIVY
jgi:hypothetical protein